MVALNVRFPKIRYQKITWEDFEKLTPELIKQISEIDNLFYRSPSDILRYIKNRKQNADKTIIYLMFSGKDLLGSVFGHVKPVSEFYNKEYEIKANPKDNMFLLTELFISPHYQNKGIGTTLMARVFADQRVKHKVKFIYMTAFPQTQRINEKLTGNRPFLIQLKNRIKTKEVNRNFEHSKQKYELVNSTQKPDIEPSKRQFIVITENPNYKKRIIRSRAK